MEKQDFLTSCKCHIKNESKVGDIKIKTKNGIELNLVGYKSMVNEIRNFGIDPALVVS